MFSSVDKMNVHMRRHEGRLDFSCSKCDKKFPTKYGLSKHLMTHDKKFECNKCGKKFARKDVLELHMKSHQQCGASNLIVDYICSYCQLPFNTSEELLGHFEASKACSEGSQEHTVYQEVVHYQTDIETTECQEEEVVESSQNVILVNNVINQQIIIIEEHQPVLLFKH